MKKLFILIATVMVLVQVASAQAAKDIFFELGGPGLASFNFDTRFTAKESGIGGRIGVGVVSFDGSGVIFLPLGLNYLLGKDSKNYFEIGGGVTPVFGTGSLSGEGISSGTFGHLNFGYRLQPLNGGFTFRAFMCPVFGNGFFWPYYGGVSFGYKF